jgi:photosystem II stability/assembly factor-like uncharacterized protein
MLCKFASFEHICTAKACAAHRREASEEILNRLILLYILVLHYRQKTVAWFLQNMFCSLGWRSSKAKSRKGTTMKTCLADRKMSAVLLMTALCFLTLTACMKEQKQAPTKPPFTFVTPNHLFAVASHDPQHIWVIGFDSVIMHSADGGATWKPQKSPVTNSLCDVFFINATTGWIAGRAGIVLHTTDGGATWKKQESGVTNHLFAVSFADERNGWAVGDFGTILHTADGGATWQKQGSGEDKIYNDVYFIDALHGWVVGEYGTMYATSDGGANWQKQECKEIIPVATAEEWESFPPSLYGVHFSDAARGLACGMDGTIIATADGGATWRKVNNPAGASKITLYKIKCSGTTCLVAGQKGTALVSADGGATWQLPASSQETKSWLRDLDMADAGNGFAVGARGTILKTQDGAQTWKMLSGIPVAQK